MFLGNREAVSREVKVAEQKEVKIKAATAGELKSRGGDRADALEEHKRSQPVPIAAGGPSPDQEAQAGDQEGPLEKAQREAAENRDRWMRAVAELENFKKRAMQEKTRILKYRNEELLRDLLPVKDNLERALSYCEQAGRSNGVAEGVCMISGMLADLFQRYGVTKIEALGKPFDPAYHDAIARLPVADKAPNVVVEELEQGYMYQDKLLRPTKVVVSGPPSQGQDD